MGMYEDIKGAKDLWRESTTATKVVLAISAIFAFSPIASLSDTVFEWKGFIKDGVEFYNGTVPVYFQKAINNLGGNISKSWANYYLIATLYLAGQLRILLLLKSDWRGYIFFGFWFSWCVLGLIHRSIYDIEITPFYYISIAVVYFIPPFLFRWPREFKFLYFVPALIAIFGVCILAAVNEGLSRS